MTQKHTELLSSIKAFGKASQGRRLDAVGKSVDSYNLAKILIAPVSVADEFFVRGKIVPYPAEDGKRLSNVDAIKLYKGIRLKLCIKLLLQVPSIAVYIIPNCKNGDTSVCDAQKIGDFGTWQYK